MEILAAPDSTLAPIRIGEDGRHYVRATDPRLGRISDARIEPCLTDNYINLSFEPYLRRRPDLLPPRSRQISFARRPAYAFLKADLGLEDYNYHFQDLDILGQEDLKAKTQILGTPVIIMAPWAPNIAQVILKLQWPNNSKSFTTIDAWNSVFKVGDKAINLFWEAVGQLKPTYRVGHDWQSYDQLEASREAALARDAYLANLSQVECYARTYRVSNIAVMRAMLRRYNELVMLRH